GWGVLGPEPVELPPRRGQQRLLHQVPARAATVVEVVADRLVLDLGHAPKRRKQLRQKLELPHPFAWTARVEHVAVVVVVLEQDVPDDLVLSEDAAWRVVRLVLQEAGRAAGVDAEGRYPAELRPQLLGAPRQRCHCRDTG